MLRHRSAGLGGLDESRAVAVVQQPCAKEEKGERRKVRAS